MELPLQKFGKNKEFIKKALWVAWPAVVESFFVAVIAFVDSYMVSGLGAYAVAAVGLTTQPRFLFLTPFFATNVAISALVARRKGHSFHTLVRIHLDGVLQVFGQAFS